MKPTLADLEMPFLLDLSQRLAQVEADMQEGRPVKSWVVAGMRNAISARISEVQRRREQCQHSEVSQDG